MRDIFDDVLSYELDPDVWSCFYARLNIMETFLSIEVHMSHVICGELNFDDN